MIKALRQIFRPKPEPVPPAIPAGQRVYAVGDVHGRLDLFEAVIAAIEADDAVRMPSETTIVLLGDLVDRGPDSAGVLAAARALTARRKVRIIAGNHEEMFLQSRDDTETLRHFLRFGGRETILSYPVDIATYRELTVEETQDLMLQIVPADDFDFMEGFEDSITIGDYLFVHAGVRPDVALEDQKPKDMRWIREPFLSHDGDLPGFVVHGHSITQDVDVQANRIGIDTGAFSSGKLTVLGLEGTKRWLIETSDADGLIETAVCPL